MRTLGRFLAVFACAACLCSWGCSRQETPKGKTPGQIRAEIQKVRNDPNMPPNVKGMVLGLLQRELAQAEKAEKGGK
jgi:hypothetical protein